MPIERAIRISVLIFAAALWPARAQNCVYREIGPEDAQQGSIASDCRLRDVVSGSRDNSYGVPFRVTVTTPGILTANMSSTAVDSYLYVVSLAGAQVASNDNAAAGTRDARIAISLDPGTYVLFAAARGGATGAFSLKTAYGKRSSCTVGEIAAGTPAGGELTDSGCRYQDLIAPSRDRSPVAAYRMQVPRRSVLAAKMDGKGLSPWLELFDADWNSITYTDASGESAAEVLASVEPGSYVLLASVSDQTMRGTFTLQASLEDPRTCSVEELAAGDSMAGELREDDCRALDLEVPSDDASPVKLYKVAVSRRGILSAEMTSKLFNPWVGITDEAGKMLVSNNDAEEDTAPVVATSVAPGTYFIFANTWDDDGWFRVGTAFEDPRACEAREIQAGVTAEGSLVPGGCRVMDAVAPSADANYAAVYTLNAAERGLLSAEAANLQDPALYLFQADSAPVASAGARFITVLNPGAYTLVASDTQGRDGAFTLALAAAAPPVCAVEELAPDGTASGVLDEGACRIREVAAGSTGASYARSYRIDIAQAGTLRLEAASRLMAMGLVLCDSGGKPSKAAEAAVNGAARMRVHVAPGAYTVHAISKSAGQTGAFELKSAFTADPSN